MKKYSIGVICLLIGFIIGILVKTYTLNDSNIIIDSLDKTDSLQSIVDKLRIRNDSLLYVIDTTGYKIKIIEKIYEKELDSIYNQPITCDVDFFTEYLSNAIK